MTARSLHITAATQGRLRRLNLVTAMPPFILAAIVIVAVDLRTWWHALVLAPGAVAALVAFERWTANDLSRVVVPCVLVAGAVWPAAVLVTGSPNSYWGLCTVGSAAVPRLARYRGLAVAGLVVFIAGVGLLRLPIEPGRRTWIEYVLVPTGITVLVIVLSFVGERFYDIIQELEQSREREAELAVTRERVRFAGDLHDIQGHTLHVVKLKAALARKLVHTDPARAGQELDEIHTLVGDTIRQTRDLVYAQRRLNLTAELENAKNLFEAAGIKVRVIRQGEADAPASELLGQVLRETTTNILRHAQASRVRITLGADGITIVNDGARGDGVPELRGLAVLRQRVAENGGELTVEQSDGEFTTAATTRRQR